jgi:tRNA(fMet)-specific endonuclease VapC
MILLDTDHLTVLAFPEHAQHGTLQSRMAAAQNETFATTVVSAEEQMRGWLAFINRVRAVEQQSTAYDRLAQLFRFFSQWTIVSFDTQAAQEFRALRKQKIRIGTMDLKIASIALVHNALLLSANLQDFQQVPGLRVENWLTP